MLGRAEALTAQASNLLGMSVSTLSNEPSANEQSSCKAVRDNTANISRDPTEPAHAGLLTEEFKESLDDSEAPSKNKQSLETTDHESGISGQENGPLGEEDNAEKSKTNHVDQPFESHGDASQQAGSPDELKIYRMHKFSLYETQSRYYLVGGDVLDSHFRILKIDRTAAPERLAIVEDDIVYTKLEMDQLLSTIDDGNRSSGGMKLKANTWGLLGFIRFTDAFYMVMITKKQQVAMIGGHYIYQVDGTELVPLSTGSSSLFQSNRNPEETRFLAIFNNLDLQRAFYFSYSYNITRTLQLNIGNINKSTENTNPTPIHDDLNKMFVWNNHLLSPALKALKNPYDWCMPIIHGFIDQSSVDVFGRSIYVTIIARRSRFFAGARFLKRGANDLGYVANDVETEQIVADMLVTPYDAFTGKTPRTPNYTSFVQHRGSIPLYWTQDNSGVTPKPAIDLSLIDPFYSTAALHFDHLFERYGAPVIVLNLVKARERTPRESKLLVEYQNAVNYLNQSLPPGKKILYRAYDMSRAAKTRGQDVIGTLEKIASEVVSTTGFFSNHSGPAGWPCLQSGVVRSNCIDCLDRTNAAQFVVGKRALAAQLQALGVIASDSLNYDSDAVNLFAHMFNDHGDTLASQYGGSHLVNTTDSYRKIANWQSHSRDMLESFKRYYHNSFLDSQRQEAYNLFLGNYVFAHGQPMLWELPNDYYLHHANPAALQRGRRRDYINWFTPSNLSAPSSPCPSQPLIPPQQREDWWHEYYRPSVVSSFPKIFAYRMNSTSRYLPRSSGNGSGGGSQSPRYNMSPFCVRKPTVHDGAQPRSRAAHDDVAIADVNNREVISPLAASSPPHSPAKRISSLQAWLNPTASAEGEGGGGAANDERSGPVRSLHSSSSAATALATSKPKQGAAASTASAGNPPPLKPPKHQWTLAQQNASSLDPHVSASEAAEYARYTTYPLRLAALVVFSSAASSATVDASAARDLLPLPHELAAEAEQDAAVNFAAYVRVPDEPLAVTAHDVSDSKRYAAYGKWLRGKSLFKQSKVDPEYVVP